MEGDVLGPVGAEGVLTEDLRELLELLPKLQLHSSRSVSLKRAGLNFLSLLLSHYKIEMWESTVSEVLRWGNEHLGWSLLFLLLEHGLLLKEIVQGNPLV